MPQPLRPAFATGLCILAVNRIENDRGTRVFAFSVSSQLLCMVEARGTLVGVYTATSWCRPHDLSRDLSRVTDRGNATVRARCAKNPHTMSQGKAIYTTPKIHPAGFALRPFSHDRTPVKPSASSVTQHTRTTAALLLYPPPQTLTRPTCKALLG